MARPSANSLLNSLKGKIWLATSALAFFICTFGLISYLIVALIEVDVFYAVFIPFLFLAFTVMVFGWWLSNEVVSPIEKVSLLAKSLERGNVVSLPRTSGSIETDELLQTLHRSNQQIQTLVGLMDKVAAGNLDVALTPLQNSDRLSGSFQKLLTKVSESIYAKQELEKLETAVEKVTGEVSAIKNGKFDVEISSDSAQTREISESINFLLKQLNNLTANVKNRTVAARNSADEVQKCVLSVIHTSEDKISEMKRATLTLAQVPHGVRKLSEELAVLPAADSIEKARRGTQTAKANLNAVSGFRKQIQDTVKRIGQFEKHSREIAQIGKTIEDIVNRTNMIALNASIKAVEAEEKNNGFSILAEELENLSVRAETTGKQILSLNKTFFSQIGETEQSLQAAVNEAAKLSEFAVETGNSLSATEKYIGDFLKLREKLAAYAAAQSTETEQAFQTFVSSISESEKDVKILKESDAHIKQFSSSLETLQSAATNLKTISNQVKVTEISVPVVKPENYAIEPVVEFVD
jgi:methyl-accepting chemotaxis protein